MYLQRQEFKKHDIKNVNFKNVIIMVNKEIITATSEAGLPALKELFNKLSKEDALKGLGLMIILGISKMAIDAVKDIVKNK